jgi:hypothetical protein
MGCSAGPACLTMLRGVPSAATGSRVGFNLAPHDAALGPLSLPGCQDPKQTVNQLIHPCSFVHRIGQLLRALALVSLPLVLSRLYRLPARSVCNSLGTWRSCGSACVVLACSWADFGRVLNAWGIRCTELPSLMRLYPRVMTSARTWTSQSYRRNTLTR